MKWLMFRRCPFYDVLPCCDGVCFLTLSSFIFTNVWTSVGTSGRVGTWVVPALGNTVCPNVFVVFAKAAGASVPVLAFWVAFVVVRLATDRTLFNGNELVKFL